MSKRWQKCLFCPSCHVRVTAPFSAHPLARTHPTMSCICQVYEYWCQKSAITEYKFPNGLLESGVLTQCVAFLVCSIFLLCVTADYPSESPVWCGCSPQWHCSQYWDSSSLMPSECWTACESLLCRVGFSWIYCAVDLYSITVYQIDNADLDPNDVTMTSTKWGIDN